MQMGKWLQRLKEMLLLLHLQHDVNDFSRFCSSTSPRRCETTHHIQDQQNGKEVLGLSVKCFSIVMSGNVINFIWWVTPVMQDMSYGRNGV